MSDMRVFMGDKLDKKRVIYDCKQICNVLEELLEKLRFRRD